MKTPITDMVREHRGDYLAAVEDLETSHAVPLGAVRRFGPMRHPGQVTHDDRHPGAKMLRCVECGSLRCELCYPSGCWRCHAQLFTVDEMASGLPDELHDYEVSNGHWRVVAEYIGEGYSGDYDDTDPDDKPLMRYDFFRRGEEEAVDSYCTLIPITDSEAVIGMAYLFLDTLDDSDSFPKRSIEYLTWTEPEVARSYWATNVSTLQERIEVACDASART